MTRAWVLPFDDLAVLKGTYARLLFTPDLGRDRTPTSLDLAGLRWTLGALRARSWTVLDALAELCKQVITAAAWLARTAAEYSNAGDWARPV